MKTQQNTVTASRTPVRIIETPVFNFDDLDDYAKERARDWLRQFALDHQWWDSIYADAETIGLKITSFDLDRNRHAEGKLTKYAGEVIDAILANHGEQCETFKTAIQYKGELQIAEKNDASQYEIDEIEAEFLKSILEDYSIMLQRESEYLVSDEVVDDTILANEYTFTAEGEREG